MADLFQILGIDEEYDSRMSKWLWRMFAESKDDDEFLKAIGDRLGTMSQVDAFTCGMFVEALLIFRTMFRNPDLVLDMARRFYRSYKKYRNKQDKANL